MSLEPATTAATTPVRGEVWFEDGNVIIQAGATQFRVHTAVLSQRYDFFRGLFGLPQPSEANDCPTILFHDTAEDMKHLLFAVYHHPNAGDPTAPPRPMPFPVLSSLLRLGRKYDLCDLRDNALSRLKAEYPCSDLLTQRSSDATFISEDIGVHFQIAALVKELGLNSLLPSVLYTIISLFDFNVIFNGLELDGRTITLSPDIQRDCVLGHARLLDKMPPFVYRWLYETPVKDTCTRPSSCREAFTHMRESSWKVLRDPYYAIADWDAVFSVLNDEDLDLCEDCELAARRGYERGRKELWDGMPSNFDMGCWESAKEKDCF